jgi:hypothetical protein
MGAIKRSIYGTEPPVLSAAECEETVLLEWTVHLLRQDPRRAWAVLGAMLLAAILGLFFFFSIYFGVLGALLVFTASAEFLLPIRYRLTDRRAMASYGLAQLDLPWHRVNRILEGPDAFKLSPFAKPSRLDGIRGVTLRWQPEDSPANRENVLKLVRAQVDSARAENTSGESGGP